MRKLQTRTDSPSINPQYDVYIDIQNKSSDTFPVYVCHLNTMGINFMKIRRSDDCIIFTVGLYFYLGSIGTIIFTWKAFIWKYGLGYMIYEHRFGLGGKKSHILFISSSKYQPVIISVFLVHDNC